PAKHQEQPRSLEQQRGKREEATLRINNLGGAKSDDQKGPNQVDKTSANSTRDILSNPHQLEFRTKWTLR
ncbi:MAG: hypothetical protein LAP13_14480, partial [Acidobacteriia bacterium]|nr:hypothetical protein [Terriglobia bacterium]